MIAKIKHSPFEVDVMPYFDNGWFVGFCTIEEHKVYFKPDDLDFSGTVQSEHSETLFADCYPSAKLSNLISRAFDKDFHSITLGDIASKPRRYFMSQRNFGQISLAELERILDRYSLKLKP